VKVYEQLMMVMVTEDRDDGSQGGYMDDDDDDDDNHPVMSPTSSPVLGEGLQGLPRGQLPALPLGRQVHQTISPAAWVNDIRNEQR